MKNLISATLKTSKVTIRKFQIWHLRIFSTFKIKRSNSPRTFQHSRVHYFIIVNVSHKTCLWDIVDGAAELARDLSDLTRADFVDLWPLDWVLEEPFEAEDLDDFELETDPSEDPLILATSLFFLDSSLVTPVAVFARNNFIISWLLWFCLNRKWNFGWFNTCP